MIDYNVILQKLKAFQTKYGNDFDANLGKLNLLAECEKVNKQLHKIDFRFTHLKIIDDFGNFQNNE